MALPFGLPPPTVRTPFVSPKPGIFKHNHYGQSGKLDVRLHGIFSSRHLPLLEHPLFVPPSFLFIFLLKIPMNLTDEQWCLIEPIIPPLWRSRRATPIASRSTPAKYLARRGSSRSTPAGCQTPPIVRPPIGPRPKRAGLRSGALRRHPLETCYMPYNFPIGSIMRYKLLVSFDIGLPRKSIRTAKARWARSFKILREVNSPSRSPAPVL